MVTLTTIRDVATIIAALTASVVATIGLSSWKKQLRGRADYDLARRYLRAIYKIRDAIKYVRNPFIPIHEMDEARKEDKINEEEWKIYENQKRAIYSRRWKKVNEAGSELTLELREAQVLWGSDAVEIEKDLEECIKKLFVGLKMFIEGHGRMESEIIYEGYGKDGKDEFNEALNRAIEKIENYLKLHLGR